MVHSFAFDCMAIIDGESRSANALAQENCELLAISSEDFISLLKNHFSVSLGLMAELAKRLRKSDQHIEALSLSDAEHRIGVSILNLAVLKSKSSIIFFNLSLFIFPSIANKAL